MEGEFLFVYGSLREAVGHPLFRTLKTHGIFRGTGRCPGRLYDMGDYPGMLPPAHEGEFVHGELYELKSAEEAFRILDPYEGFDESNYLKSEFIRKTAIILTESGEERLAWLYYLNAKSVDETRRIATGDYLKRSET